MASLPDRPPPATAALWLTLAGAARNSQPHINEERVSACGKLAPALQPRLARPRRGRIVAQPFLSDFPKVPLHLDLVDPDVDVVEQCLILATQQDRNIHRIEHVLRA